MTSVADQPRPLEPRRLPTMPVPELWASISISIMWIAVAVCALFGPNIETSNEAGTNTSSVPSAVPVALLAFLGTWVLARYAFRRVRSD